MAGCHRKISSFLIFANIVLVIDGLKKGNWYLNYNWTSEMQCPQIVETSFSGSNLKYSSWQWKVDDDIFANYTYNDSDTDFPIKVNSSTEGLEVIILYVSEEDHYTLNATVIAESDIIQNKVLECSNGNARGSSIKVKVNFNCVDVYLQVNDTVEGDICPAGLNFSSIAMNVKSIVWYFGQNELINYTVKSKFTKPLDLCLEQETYHNLTDLCDNGGSVTINEITGNGSRYDVISTVILTGTYIFDRQYLYVESGSNNITKTKFTNFTLVCGSKDLKINSNITDDDSNKCDDVIVEFVCVGNNVPNFFWVFNNVTSMLSTNYTYSPSSFPMIVKATILDLNILISADTNNCLDKHFNFDSTLTVSRNSLIKKSIMSIGCVTDDLQSWTAVNCTATPHWWHKLSFLDKFPFCHVAESKSLSECAECFGIVLAILIIIIVIFSCVCCCCCKCIQGIRRRKKKARYQKLKSAEDAESNTNQISGNTSIKPNEEGCIPFDHSPKEKRKWKTLFKKKKTSETQVSQVDGSDALKEQKQSSAELKSEGFKFAGDVEIKQDQKSKTEPGLMGTSPPIPISPTSSSNNSLKTLPTDSPKILDSPGQAALPTLEALPTQRPITPSIVRPTTPSTPIPTLPDPGQTVRDEERRAAENAEREKANELSKGSFPQFVHYEKLEDLGSRLQKFWYIRKSKDRKTITMQFTVKVSRKCPITLEERDVAVLKEFFACLKHPNLLPILDAVRHKDFISILQDFMESGSIRDILFGVNKAKL